MTRPDLDRIRSARTSIDPVFLHSPQYGCAALGCAVTLKVETLNPVRSFKGRGTDTRTANPLEIERIRALGATVRLEGEDIEDARLVARALAERGGAHLIEDSLDVATCEGAATIGLELLEAPAPPLDALLIALGGGALARGVGHVATSLAPHVEVVAVEPTGAPAMALSWRRGSVVQTDTIDTIADGVAGRCPSRKSSTTC